MASCRKKQQTGSRTSLFCGKSHYLINTYVIMSESLKALNIYFLLKLTGKEIKKKEEKKESRKRGVQQRENKEDHLKIRGWLNAGIDYTSISPVVVARWNNIGLCPWTEEDARNLLIRSLIHSFTYSLLLIYFFNNQLLRINLLSWCSNWRHEDG